MHHIPLRKLIPGVLILSLLLAACTAVGNQSTIGGSDPAPRLPTPTTISAEDAAPSPDAGPASTRFPAAKYADLELVTLLPRDAIPAVDNPRFLPMSEADAFYDPDELVMGVAFNGEARAYSVPFLSNHEIVNDTVGGVKIAVTW